MKPVLKSILLMGCLVLSLAALTGVCAGSAFAAEGAAPDLSISNIAGGSIFGGATPAILTAVDPNAVELGVRFESEVPLAIEGVRFYRGPHDTGTHVGHLWSSTGTLLASATFTSETSYGWQSVRFEKPVMIEPHTVYVASYFAPNGGYSATNHFFEHGPVVNGPVRALGGVNGVYTYGSTSEFPTMTYEASNYYVDVMYSTVLTAGQPANLTVDASNMGTAASGTATVSDTLPSGLAWTQDDPGDCSIATATLTCHFSSLESGATRVVHLSATTSSASCNQVTRTGTLESTATLSDSSLEDSDTLDKSAGASMVVNCPVAKCPLSTTQFPTLEPSSPFALFALGAINGKQQGTLSGATIHGSVAVAPGASLLTQSPSSVTGNLYLGSGGTFTGPLTVSGTTQTGVNLTATRLIAGLVNVVAGVLRPNFSYTGVTSNTTVTGVAGLNVVNVKGNINLANAALTLSGPSNAYFVLNVSGSITLSGTGAIKVGGSVESSRVLVNMTGGGAINTGSGDIVEGTLLGPTSGGSLGGGFGDLLLGANFSLMPGSQVGLQSCS